MLKWQGAHDEALEWLRLHRKGKYPVVVGRVDANRMFSIWPGEGTLGQVDLPWPDGMELGDDLKKYVEAQWYLLDKP